jgi:hypothetical protein
MDKSLSYIDIIKKTLHDATITQPQLQAIRLYPVCDIDSGHFLVLATGWDKQCRIDSVLFHARLVDRQIIIEEDNFEEGLINTMISAGIKSEDIVINATLCLGNQTDGLDNNLQPIKQTPNKS